MRPAGEQREDAPDPETKAVLAALQRDAERLRLLGGGGPDWERLRARAFRVMVVRPLRCAWAWCLGRLGQRIRERIGAATPPAYRAETVQEVRQRTE
jgi:hypothetical protein